jgi:hypothetical protein
MVEAFDRWDHTLQDGNDTEADVVIVALCVGLAFSVAGVVIAWIRTLSSESHSYVAAAEHESSSFSQFKFPLPTGSPPPPLRV